MSVCSSAVPTRYAVASATIECSISQLLPALQGFDSTVLWNINFRFLYFREISVDLNLSSGSSLQTCVLQYYM